MKESFIEKPLPSNLECERSVLGAALLDNKSLDAAMLLKPEDFFLDQHRRIFVQMLAMRESQQPIDLVTLTEEMHKRDELEASGGAAYLAALADGMPRVTNVEHYARIVKQKAILRNLIHATHNIQVRAFEGEESVESILDLATQAILDLAIGAAIDASDGKSYWEAGARLLLSFDKKDSIRIQTGIEMLDKLTGGFRAGELITLTAGTGVGKTLLAQQIRRRACADGLHTLYASGEMTAEHLVSRELATEAGVDHRWMRRPEVLSPEEMRSLFAAVDHECKKCRILDGELSLRRIRVTARRMQHADAHHRGVNCLIVDYDELVDAPGHNEIEQQRNLIRGLKLLSMELQIPVIVISQLRKSLDKDDAKKPTLERMYGSGAKSKHSSFVVFVDREFVRELKGDETQGRICLLKARDGRLGQFNVKFNLKTLRFEDAPADPLSEPPANLTSGMGKTA